MLIEFSLNSDCFSLATSPNYSSIHIGLEPTETECCSYVFTWSRYNFLFRVPVSENIKLQWFMGWLKLFVLPRDGTRNEISIKSDFPLQSKGFESEHTPEPFVCQMGGGNSVEKMQSRCEKKSAWWHAKACFKWCTDVSNMLSCKIPEHNKAKYSLLTLWELN